MTLKRIRRLVAEAFAETSFFPRTNQTYYPARWVYGAGTGDATTSDYYDVRLLRAAEYVAATLGLLPEAVTFCDLTRQLDAAWVIATALREQAAREAREAHEGAEAGAA